MALNVSIKNQDIQIFIIMKISFQSYDNICIKLEFVKELTKTLKGFSQFYCDKNLRSWAFNDISMLFNKSILSLRISNIIRLI